MTLARPMFPPVDPTRRRLLTVAAGGAVAGLIPTAVLAGASIGVRTDESEDPAFALIRAKREADVLHCWAIEAQDAAESRHGLTSEAARKAQDRCYAACEAVNNADWRLATTPPTTLCGVMAVLRLANLIEDEGCEWPMTDTIGPDGWHYQLRATMAAAIEALIKAGKVMQS